MTDNLLLFFVFSIGFFIYLFSNKYRWPTSLLLVILGILFRNLSVNGYNFEVYTTFLNLAILFIIIILFVFLNEFSFHELDLYSEKGLKISLINIVINVLFFSFFIYLFFKLNFLFLILVSLMLTTTDYSVYNHIIKKDRVFEFLKYESMIGSSIVIVLVFLIFSILNFTNQFSLNNMSFLLPFFSDILLGVAIGIIMAIIFFDILKNISHWITEYLIFLGLVITYLVAYFLQANGIFAVVFYSLIFERMTFKRKDEVKKLLKFVSLFASASVFIILGLVIPSYDKSFLLQSFLLFLIYLILRFFSLFVALFGVHQDIKDIIFMTLNCPKGIDVIAILFINNQVFV
ncbi:MAG: cation:proton antiporter [Candidatus Woesearchaeota archaeon]